MQLDVAVSPAVMRGLLFFKSLSFSASGLKQSLGQNTHTHTHLYTLTHHRWARRAVFYSMPVVISGGSVITQLHS